MFDRIRQWVLRVARVPAAPQPPYGDPASVRVFRAGRNLYRLRVVAWVGAQAVTAFGIVLSLGFLQEMKADLREREEPVAISQPTETNAAEAAPPRRMRDPGRHAAQQVARHVPAWVLPLLIVGEAIGIAAYLLQLPVTFAALRLDYELRWYMVTDRSLRIRSGVWVMQESTMSFANLQQVEVRQGPLQRVLGIADVRVRSAGGGGGGDEHHKGQTDTLHTGVFHGVEHAAEIRDLILDRLRLFRAGGLGDPDDVPETTGDDRPVAPLESTAVVAARELLAEAQALRRAVRG